MAKLNINGRVLDLRVEDDTPLLWALREQAGLTGTKYGCGIGACGACSVHVNDEIKRSCTIPVASLKPTDRIVTIEALSGPAVAPVLRAWAANDVPQCGYCQTGQVMAAVALLRAKPSPSEREIEAAMTNICRCGTYQRIRQAIRMAAAELAAQAPARPAPARKK